MMLYSVLRAVGGIALRWFYRDLEVHGLEHLPDDTPVLLVANHPNALVDALAIGHAVPRPVRLTAKATFFAHPVIGPLFRSVGIIPLHRQQDADAVTPGGTVAVRNRDAFRAILDALEQRGTVLIFPEGTTHSAPQMVPLRSGAARLALSAVRERGITGLRVIPTGLVFEDKARPRSRVLVQFGAPLDVGRWLASDAGTAGDSVVPRLTAAIDERLRAVTLNFPSVTDGAAVTRTARLLADALDPPRPVASPDRPLAAEFALIQRVEAARRLIAVTPGPATPVGLAARAAALVERVEAFAAEAAAQGIAINDVDISLSPALGARFALREGAIVLGTAPLAWWGRLNHWLPFRAATALGRRRARTPEEPAMYTIISGLAIVVVAYAIQATLVGWWLGEWWAAIYLTSLPPSASWDLRYRERLARALDRMRAYLRFRREPDVQRRLAAEVAALRREAKALGELMTSAERASSAPRAPVAAGG